jgi:hypothetical protein
MLAGGPVDHGAMPQPLATPATASGRLDRQFRAPLGANKQNQAVRSCTGNSYGYR